MMQPTEVRDARRRLRPDVRAVMRSAAGRDAFARGFQRAFARGFWNAFNSAVLGGVVGSTLALRWVSHSRPAGAPPLGAGDEIGIAMTGAAVVVGLSRLGAWAWRRTHSGAA